MLTKSGPSCAGLVNRPFQAMKAYPGRARRTATGSGSICASCIVRARVPGSSSPIGNVQARPSRAVRSRRGPVSGPVRRPRRAAPSRRHLPAIAGGRRARQGTDCRPRQRRPPRWIRQPGHEQQDDGQAGQGLRHERSLDKTGPPTNRWARCRAGPRRRTRRRQPPRSSSGSAQVPRSRESPAHLPNRWRASSDRRGCRRGARSVGYQRDEDRRAIQQARTNKRIRHWERSLTSSNR